MGRAPCCEKLGLKKGPWTPEEDQKLIAYIQQHGHGSWRALPQNAGLLRCGKSCRLRWTNYLRPDIKRGRFSSEEEQMIIQLHAILGNRWSAISTHLPGRTDNEIKNYWNTHLKKRLLQLGIDPVTHKPKSDLFESFVAKPLLSSTLSHMAQWENARLEAEARLARGSFRFSSSSCQPPANVNDVQPKCFGSVWKKEVEENIHKEFSTSRVSSDQTLNELKTNLRECDQPRQMHPFSVCDGITEERLCSSNLRFPPSQGLVSPHLDGCDATFASESLGTNVNFKGVSILVQNIPSSSSCSLAIPNDHGPKTVANTHDSVMQCESLLQQSEKLLRSKLAFFTKGRLSTDIIQNSSDKECERSSATTTECSSYQFVSPPFSDGFTNNTTDVFWAQSNSPQGNDGVAGTSPSTSNDANELISQDTTMSMNFPDYTVCYSSGLPSLPMEVSLDLTNLQQLGKINACTSSEDLTSFSDQSFSMQSKDYWCNVLKFVGSPVLG